MSLLAVVFNKYLHVSWICAHVRFMLFDSALPWHAGHYRNVKFGSLNSAKEILASDANYAGCGPHFQHYEYFRHERCLSGCLFSATNESLSEKVFGQSQSFQPLPQAGSLRYAFSHPMLLPLNLIYRNLIEISQMQDANLSHVEADSWSFRE